MIYLDHLGEKLAALRLTIRRTLAGSQTPRFAFTEARVECLAETEHARWNVERLLEGWTFSESDKANKVSSYLISWAELPENIRECDRLGVRDIPGRLDRLGYKIVALAESKTT